MRTRPVPRLVVAGPHRPDPQEGLSTGMTLVIARTPDDGLAVGQRYVASRLTFQRKLFSTPDEIVPLRVHGYVTVTAIDDLNALANIDFSCDPILAGDYLEPYAELALPTEATSMDLTPDFSDRALLIFGIDTRSLVGSGDIISINRGSEHGVVAGARYAVYRDKHQGLNVPLIHIGEAVVMEVGAQTSKVMVTKAADGIMSGDVAVPRKLQPQQ